jgi:GH25 family lysozyme M1 (1,4-beta-N-acetylmuramidase)
MRECARSFGIKLLGAIALFGFTAVAPASDFSEPWERNDRALVIDAYEYNVIDWQKLATDKRIIGFIGKGSDGLPPAYRCSGDETEEALCSALWKRYSVAKELFHTRRAMAKSLGLEWGAYHLARPGNPMEQANHFIDFAQPGPDDLVALDIEDNDPEKWMSFEDAEEFARHIKRRIGRYPVLYTNGNTAQFIADNRDRYPLLSRLPLWYARYKPEIGMHFPKGNWENYALWQFVSQINCNKRSCPYRPAGTNYDIDVNVASMSVEELRKAWPFDALIEVPEQLMASVPVPTSRAVALGGGDVTLTYASVERPKSVEAFAKVFAEAGAELDDPALESNIEVAAASAEIADSQTPAARVIKPALGQIKQAATYVRLSALRPKPAPLAATQRAEAMKQPPSDQHVGLAEYLAWRKDNGLPVKVSASTDKSARLTENSAGEQPSADAVAIPVQAPRSDPTSTGSIAIAIADQGKRDALLTAADQADSNGPGWFARMKGYLGLFN